MFSEYFSYANYKQADGEVIYARYDDGEIAWQGGSTEGFYELLNAAEHTKTGIQSYSGIKFHISIDDSEGQETNLTRAWDLIKDILLKYNIKHAKVAKETCHLSNNEETDQYGKQITIYASEDARANDLDFWKNVFYEIEQALANNNIAPDPNADRYVGNRLSGSKYFHYRNDAVIIDQFRTHLSFIKYINDLSWFDKSSVESLELNLEGNVHLQYLPNETYKPQEIAEMIGASPEEIPKNNSELISWVANQADFLEIVNLTLSGERDAFGQHPVHNSSLADPFEKLSIEPSFCSSLCEVITSLDGCFKSSEQHSSLEQPLLDSGTATSALSEGSDNSIEYDEGSNSQADEGKVSGDDYSGSNRASM